MKAQVRQTSVETVRPHGNLRWGIAFFLLLFAIINNFDRSNLSIANPLISKQFHLGPAAMGVLLSAFLWPYAISNLVAGWMVDRTTPRRMLAAATGSWSLVSLLTGFANSFGFFYFMRVLLGIAESPFFSVGIKIIDRWFPKKERATAASIYNAGGPVANAIAPPLLTALMLSLGWQGMFMVLGVTGLVLTGVWLAFYRDPTHKKHITPEEYAYISTESKEKDENNNTKKTSWGSLFKYRSTWAMIVGNMGIGYVFWTYLTWLPGYLEQARHLSILKTGWMASIPFLAGIIGVPLGGAISDYFLRNGYKPIVARKIIILTSAILTAVAVAPVAYVSNLTLCMVLLSVGFFASSLQPGVVWTLATDVAPSDRVASLGAIQNFGGYIGATAAPIVTGLIVQNTHTFNLVFIVGAILCVVAALSYGFFLREPIK
ncbi:MAG: MFS transporter [Alicyclobacillus macrosporangiidus]|uniref:MFS transporter n=1 Tax=Alicyclobacillus macrosporangiidus TaxID=392015 RepID=UPI0026F0EBCE|nr:MFS transporter [Alicyclobacillus macrosporangiidus]MCL6599948.1 MFS transporter [Alicyclobacillus macrosporangiidus]